MPVRPRSDSGLGDDVDVTIVLGLAQGLTCDEIAAALLRRGGRHVFGITGNAVKMRASRIRDALGAVNAANLVSICYERQIIVPSASQSATTGKGK